MKPLTAEEIADLEQDVHVGDFGDAGEMVSRLLDEVERSRALLKRIEWAGAYDGHDCPSCCGLEPRDGWTYDPKEPPGHKPGCELAALLG